MKTFGGLVDARLDRVVAQEADDDLGTEIIGLHEAGHVLVLFVRHIGNRSMKFGKRHHAITHRQCWNGQCSALEKPRRGLDVNTSNSGKVIRCILIG